MPISRDEFRTIGGDDPAIDLAPDTTQGKLYHFLLENADKAFRQREIVDAVDVPRGSVGPTLKRLDEHGLVTHRGQYWSIADAEHAAVSAGMISASAADELDGGFSDDDIATWMETAVDPIETDVVDDTEVTEGP